MTDELFTECDMKVQLIAQTMYDLSCKETQFSEDGLESVNKLLDETLKAVGELYYEVSDE